MCAVSVWQGIILQIPLTMKLDEFGPSQIFFNRPACGSSRNFCAKSNHPVNNSASPVNNNIPIAVEKCNDCIRSFFDTDNVVRIQVHTLFIQTCHYYHKRPDKD